MDTKQRTRPESGQQKPRTDAAQKPIEASGSGQTAADARPPRKRTSAAQPNTGRKAKAVPNAGRTAAAGSQKSGKAAGQRKSRTNGKRRRAPAVKAPQQAPAQTKPRRTRPAPRIVYTAPKPFSRNRLLLRLATVVAVVLALTFGVSIFFKVDTVTVSGNQKYTAWDVFEASGIQKGDNLLTFGEARAKARIIAALPYVDHVRIGIKLPDTVNIEIKELDVVYSIRDQSGNWWLITSGGTVVEQVDSAGAGQYTQILGVLLSLPRAGERVAALEPIVSSVITDSADGETETTAPVTVLGSEQLDTALSILQYMEANGIIGEAASVDVTDLSQIVIWYGQRYQVKLGDTTQLNYKISCMKEAVDELGDYQAGELDISFTIWPDSVGFTPFA